MQCSEDKGVIIIRLFTEESLFPSLAEICRLKQVQTAVIVSAIGQIKEFILGYFNGEKYLLYQSPMTHELISISGIISRSSQGTDYDFHLHAAVANSSHQVYGGHLKQAVVQGTS
jgi:predicted DNA-binding protein with PD1-like motif